MPRFYCPDCWKDFEKDYARCPACGLDIRGFLDSRDYTEKLIVSLFTTPSRMLLSVPHGC